MWILLHDDIHYQHSVVRAGFIYELCRAALPQVLIAGTLRISSIFSLRKSSRKLGFFLKFFIAKGIDICWQNTWSHYLFDCHPEDTACTQAESTGQFPLGTWEISRERKVFQVERDKFQTDHLLWCPLFPRVTWEIRIKSAIVIANCKHSPAMKQKLLG